MGWASVRTRGTCTQLVLNNMVFGWFGYEWWQGSEADNKEDGDKAENDKDCWIWVDNEEDKLSQDDLEFFEKKKLTSVPLKSYADIVKLSFEKCKREETQMQEKAVAKKRKNREKSNGCSSPQNTVYCINDVTKSKIRLERKRKRIGRYSPFSKSAKIVNMENFNIASDIFNRQVLPLRDITLGIKVSRILNVTNAAVETKMPGSVGSGWQIVGRKRKYPAKMYLARYPKASRLVVDVGSNGVLDLLRMRGENPILESTRLVDLCTVVDDVKPKQPLTKSFNQSMINNEANKKSCEKLASRLAEQYEVKSTKERKQKLQKNSAKKNHIKNQNIIIWNVGQSIPDDLITLKYLLGILKQPLSIEQAGENDTESNPQCVFEGFKFMEDIFFSLIGIAFSVTINELSSINSGYPKHDEDIGSSKYHYKQFRKQVTKAKYRRMGKLLRPRDKTPLGQLKEKSKLVKSKLDNNEILKNTNKVCRKNDKSKKKRRNFTPQKFSGRTGARAC